MIGMYALYGDSLYKILDQELAPNGISVNRDTHIEYVYDAGKAISQVNITVANATSQTTNGGHYKGALDLIESKKLTEVESLASIYRVFLGFRLVDVNRIVVDQGYIVTDVKPSLKFTPCHLDDANEFLNAFALEINTRFARHYSRPVPSGWRGFTKEPKYTLYITSISVYQMKMSAITLHADDSRVLVPIIEAPSGVIADPYGSSKDTPFRNWNAMVAQSRSQMMDAHVCEESRVAYTMDPNFVKDSACIFSSMNDHMEFTPIDISFDPRCIEINLKLTLDGIFVVNSDEDIAKYLEANKETTTITPDPGTDETDEPVVNPDPSEEGEVIPNPENPGTGSGTETETPIEDGTETGGSNTTGEETPAGDSTEPSGSTITGEETTDPVESPEQTESE